MPAGISAVLSATGEDRPEFAANWNCNNYHTNGGLRMPKCTLRTDTGASNLFVAGTYNVTFPLRSIEEVLDSNG